MGPVHVCVRHEYDLMVTELADIEVFPDPGTKGGNHGSDFVVAQNAIKACLLHV